MTIMVSAGEGKTFTPAPAGLHQAVCVDVVDMGVLKVVWNGQTKQQHKVRLVWQLEDMDGTRHIAQKRYTASLHEKSALRRDLESWRGRAFTPDELKAFDLERLLGANAQINIQHVTKDGTTYANVVSIVPLGRGMLKLEPKEYIRVKDRADSEAEPGSDEPLTVEDIPF